MNSNVKYSEYDKVTLSEALADYTANTGRPNPLEQTFDLGAVAKILGSFLPGQVSQVA